LPVSSKQSGVQVRRVYDEPATGDGTRVLVDRLWPRGLPKERARLHHWCRQIAPSTTLRTWYAHDPERFAEFARRYREELQGAEQAAALRQLQELAQGRMVTLLTATKETAISQAAVLADLLAGSGD
jgi:uncharacterized protein YeaO (DUF488 family)